MDVPSDLVCVRGGALIGRESYSDEQYLHSIVQET